MARKVLNRKELRAANDAAEGAEGTEAKVKPVKKATVRKSRAKVPKEVRLKAFWGVFNQSMKRVAKYDFTQRKAAEAKAAELSASGGGKSPHFIQKCKEEIEG